MTVDELKEAWRTRAPVKHRDIEYRRITALIYRRDDKNEPFLQVELLGKNNNSVVIAAPREVFPLQGGRTDTASFCLYSIY